MRLKHIFISEYKNLKNFSLDFDGDSFIDVFVGKNGTGKSNLFEALIEIFKHLFEDDYEVRFDYKLQYVLEGSEIKIEWKWVDESWFDESGKEQRKIAKEKLPDNILIYYSGHNAKVNELVTQYETKFKKGLKEANEGDTRKFIGIGKDYKSLLLSVLLLQPNQNKAKQFILEKLGIRALSPELKITLQRPEYAKKKGYEIDTLVLETRYWRAQGITQHFLDKLTLVRKGDSGGRARDEGYFKNEGYDDQYILYLDIIDFQRIFSDNSAQEVFRNFDNLKTIEMLANISIEIELLDGARIDIKQFSDGQFQSIYIYSIIELFKDRNCITLLDEPDSFLHPEWQFDFLKQVFEITDAAAVNNHILMTSHSASTIVSSKETHLNLFTFDGGTVSVSKIGKNKIIKTLSKGMINLSNNETIMNINTYLKNTIQPVLFTEGITDEYILDVAWKKLYPEERRQFCIHNAFDRIFLRNLFSRDDIRNNHPNRILFALFDFDEAYDDWKGLSIKGVDVISNPFLGLTRKLKDLPYYAMLLPVPNIDLLKCQVLKSDNTPWDKGSESHLSMELLFYKEGAENPNFSMQDISGGGRLLTFIGSKVQFAQTIVPAFPEEYFEIFRPMFEFIKSTIGANA